MKMVLTLCALALSFIANIAWAVDPVAIPGSRVSLVPPDRFVVAKEFAGLQGEKASVNVSEIPGATYERLAAGFHGGATTPFSVEILGGEELTGLPFRAHMFRGKQQSSGGEMNKWVMLIDSGPILTLINVSAIKEANTLTEAQVTNMFRSVRIAATTAGDPIDALPFAITVPPRFSHRQAVAGNSLLITQSAPSAADKGQPSLVIARTYQKPIPRAL